MFKKVIALLLASVLMFSSPALAVSSNRIKSTKGIETSQTAATTGLAAGTWVYGFKVYADASSSWAALYDATTYVAKAADEIVDEIGEATQYDSVEAWYPEPIYFENGVSVQITTGVVYIFYGPPPK